MAGATQIVLLVLDGLGAEQLRERSGAGARRWQSGAGAAITSVAPSTTACALTTLVTGRAPAEHGVVGYRVALDGDVMNVLQWSIGGVDARMRVPAPDVPAVPALPRLDRARCPWSPATTTGPPGSRRRIWATSSCTAGTRRPGSSPPCAQLAAAGEPFVYAYYEGIDKVAHAEGLGEYYDDELRAADRLVGDVLDVLPPGAVLVVTADHGQVDVGRLRRGARARDHGRT